jgi:hypothetical protein
MLHTGYVSRCISESPSYGYLNRSMLASTRLCNNSTHIGGVKQIPFRT